MGQDLHIKRIDELLRDITSLEKRLHEEKQEQARLRIERSLKLRKKRFEHLIPFPFKRKLKMICLEAGVDGRFD